MEPEETSVTEVERVLQFHKAFCHAAYEICRVKNHDYAGASGQSPFRNFQSVEFMGLATTELGFVVRILDKVNRLVTFVKDGKLKVADESTQDALLDIINYCVLLAAYIKAKGSDNDNEQ